MKWFLAGIKEMDESAHINGIGNIVTNLQALETTLRGFLVEQYDQCAQFPNMGEKIACRNYLTNWISLGELIEDYHRDLGEHEKQYSIDLSVVLVRDALAHGRLFVRGSNPSPPFELWKFGKAKDGKMPVEFSETLTEEWLKAKWLFIRAQQQKVVNCAKTRGYKRLK
jgi:hypothetical protein